MIIPHPLNRPRLYFDGTLIFSGDPTKVSTELIRRYWPEAAEDSLMMSAIRECATVASKQHCTSWEDLQQQ